MDFFLFLLSPKFTETSTAQRLRPWVSNVSQNYAMEHPRLSAVVNSLKGHKDNFTDQNQKDLLKYKNRSDFES